MISTILYLLLLNLSMINGSVKTSEMGMSSNCTDDGIDNILPQVKLEDTRNTLVESDLKIPIKTQEDSVQDSANVNSQSPERCLWEFFADHLEGDFMISSPVRNVPPPHSTYLNHHNSNLQTSTDDVTINYEDGIGGGGGQSPMPMACSPVRTTYPNPIHNRAMMSPSPLGQTYGSPNTNYYGYKGGNNKGMSPIHRVLMNSPTSQYMQIENISLPALEFLDDLEKDDPSDVAGLASSSQDCFDLSTVPELLECLSSLPDSSSTSRFSGSSSHLSTIQEHAPISRIGSSDAVPLLQQLQQERHQEKLQQLHHQSSSSSSDHHGYQLQHQMSSNTLMVPLSFGPEQEQDSGLRLVHLLLACAEAVAKEDYMLARRYLHHLNRVVTPLGDSMQRVASCFAEALSARLAATLTTAASKPSSSKPFDPFPANSLEILKIYQILYQACPYIKFAHFTANQAIFEAFEAEERVHVIDLDILQGYQWPAFMQALAARPSGAPFLRITGVGPSPESVRETGRCLTDLAHSLHIPFEFHPVGEQLEDLKPHMFNRRVGEALAVNSVDRLHRVPANALGNLLGMIRDQAPNIVTIVEKEASHNGPYFLGRFLEALHFYSAIFDSLDATFPADSAQRAKVEQYIFAPEIRNIVAHEGPERTARHERLDKWRKIMEGKGFRGVSLSSNAVTQSKILLGLYSCDGYRLTEDKGCLLLGWQDRAILAASAWRC